MSALLGHSPRIALILAISLLCAAPAAFADSPLPPGTNTGGGDDIILYQFPDIDTDGLAMVVSPNGDYYTAVGTQGADTQDIHVFRSQDGGSTWAHWGSKGLGMSDAFARPRLAMVTSPSPRLVLAYEYVKDGVWAVNISWSPLGNSASWTAKAVMADPAKNFVDPDLFVADAPAGSVLYMVSSESIAGPGDRIWFSRSIDQGQNWSAPYVIGAPAANVDVDYKAPRIAADDLGNVHVAWTVDPSAVNQYDEGVYYRHADNRAAAGLGDWDGVRVVASAIDGYDTDGASVGCQPDGSMILVSATGTAQGNALAVNWTGTGDGSLFSAAKEVNAAAGYRDATIAAHPDGGWVISGSQHWVPDYVFATWAFSRAYVPSPPTWQTPTFLADMRYGVSISHPAVAVVDPTRGNRVAMIWSDEYFDGNDMVRFDAEWRGDAGVPNLAEGFPVALASAPRTQPALHEVNPFRAGPELVYGDAAGYVHVIDTNTGTDVPGWPQFVGAISTGQTVCVGDLDGNGVFDVVAGDAFGRVHAWRGDGAILPGWPVQVGNGKTFVSLGPVSKVANQDVVVLTSTDVHLLRPDGLPTGHGVWPVALAAAPVAPASLGDLDGDGFLNVVATMGNRVSTFDHLGGAGWQGVFAGGMIAPTALGDLDADGDLELLIPGGDGTVHARHHTGAAVAGFWPQMTQPGSPVSGLALAEIDMADGIEVGALNAAGGAFLFRSTGFPYTGFPKLTPAGEAYPTAPILDDVDGGRAELLTGDSSGWMRGFKENNVALGGWPKDLGTALALTPVSGDLDNDGILKMMVLTQTSLVKVTMNGAADAAEINRWPMFAHDAQRTSCAEHGFDAVTAIGPLAASLIQFAPPSPNPVVGSTHLSYRLPGQADVRLEIFDVRGRRVRTLVAGAQGPGDHTIQWDTRDNGGQRVSQGQYFGRLMVRGDGVHEDQTRKITVIH